MNFAISLTLLRLVLGIPFAVCLFQKAYTASLVILFIMGVTDLLDGYVARKFNQKTRFGATLDPITDKIIICTGNVILALHGIVPVWFFLLVTFKDLSVLAGAIVMKLNGLDWEPEPNRAGKIAVFLQVVIILEGIIQNAFYDIAPSIIITIALSTVFTLISWALYYKFFKSLMSRKVL